MPFRDPQRHLEDVLDAIEKIEGFIGNIDLAAYRADEKTKSAVERKIQILTEAIVRLEDESPGNIRRSTRGHIAAWAISFVIPTIVSMTA
jgi:uncharacterized protein with HEPN domain